MYNDVIVKYHIKKRLSGASKETESLPIVTNFRKQKGVFND